MKKKARPHTFKSVFFFIFLNGVLDRPFSGGHVKVGVFETLTMEANTTATTAKDDDEDEDDDENDERPNDPTKKAVKKYELV